METMSARLDAADRPDDAQASSEEAVCFYRELARSKPKYLPNVARLLADQAKDLQAGGSTNRASRSSTRSSSSDVAWPTPPVVPPPVGQVAW
jgi:hypothetical protein